MKLPTKVEFVKCSPTQNMTVLVKTPVPIEHQYTVGKELIAYGHIGGEQCGFLMLPKNKKADFGLRMMAGEFCGNATISLGAYGMHTQLPDAKIGEVKAFFMEVSGAETLLSCSMEKTEQGYAGTIEMPLPIAIETTDFPFGGTVYTCTVVQFLGISHIIIERDDLSQATVEEMANAWAKEELLGEAFGILLWNPQKKTLMPYVYLKGFGGIFEHGCGSGTSAIGIYEAQKRNENCTTFCEQKGGVMSVFVELDEVHFPKKIVLKGGVSIVAEGTAFLS
ncbi:MAG: hypothetical protein R3Y53_03400 [Bacillota bacterium]